MAQVKELSQPKLTMKNFDSKEPITGYEFEASKERILLHCKEQGGKLVKLPLQRIANGTLASNIFKLWLSKVTTIKGFKNWEASVIEEKTGKGKGSKNYLQVKAFIEWRVDVGEWQDYEHPSDTWFIDAPPSIGGYLGAIIDACKLGLAFPYPVCVVFAVLLSHSIFSELRNPVAFIII